LRSARAATAKCAGSWWAPGRDPARLSRPTEKIPVNGAALAVPVSFRE
jgi:hypothetical protein